jgi:hypothetical protein
VAGQFPKDELADQDAIRMSLVRSETRFVALRTTVTDIKGNSTVETADRAYGIVAPA